MLAWVEKKYKLILVAIFLLGLLARFLYFPGNTYFAYDQARDSFNSLQLFQGNLKIIGPPSILGKQVFHGPLVYYFFGPVYFLTSHNPEAVSAFLRIYNASGIMLVFLIGWVIFNKKAGLFAAFLYAISFEQSQYALFFCHPGLAVIPALLFYLGLSLFIFKKDPRGLILSAVSIGAAIQFHYVNIFLFLPLLTLAVIFRKNFTALKLKYLFLSIIGFVISISTFIMAEFKFGFKLTSELYSFLNPAAHLTSTMPTGGLSNFFISFQRLIGDNLLSLPNSIILAIILVILAFIWVIFQKSDRLPGIFLLIWLLGGLFIYFLLNTPTYYFSPGASVSFLILLSFVLSKLWKKLPILVIFLLVIISLSNFNKITIINPQGLSLDFVIQPGMILSDQKQVIDYIYQQADHQEVAVRALTVPLNVNTTWSYLFEWYGKNKYGYLPFWVGPAAQGFPGNLQVINDRGKLPEKLFLIIEPTVGIREGNVNDFFREEGYFTKLVEEKRFGTLRVQMRERY